MTSTTTTPSSWAALVDGLAAEGVLGEQWRAAFLAVPREVFIPEVIWRDAGDELVPLRRGEQPQEWLRRAYGPDYVVTQVDDGAPAGPDGHGRVPTSSASRPDIVALMLTAAHLEPGMRVCEIGSGTGYTAALLAHHLGARNVTTIEVDPTLAARARAALARAGYGDVTVITGDGARGCPEGAPFDRVLSTVAAPRVPYPWVAQTRPGGVVLTPWSSAYKAAGLLSLTAAPDGAATGGLVNTTISFMALRDQRIPRPTVADVVRDSDTPEVSDTDLHASHLCNDDDAPFAIGLAVPDCHREYEHVTHADGHWSVWFLDADSRSWARFDHQPDTRRWPVHQFGPRRLFDEVTAAYHRWEHAGRPPATRWRFIITPHEQRVEMTDTTTGAAVSGHGHRFLADRRLALMRLRSTSTTLRALDGLNLAGTLVRPDDAVSHAVVLVHGGGVTREEGGFFTRLATGLAEAGVTSLRFDLRGHGESEGRQEEMTLTAHLNDIRVAIEYMSEAVGVTTVSLIGASFGGGLCAYYAAKRPDRLRRLVLLNPQLNYKNRYIDQKPYWFNDRLSDEAAQTLQDQGYISHSPTVKHGRAFLNEAFWISPLLALREITAPTLIVHGTEDTFIPIESSRAAVEALTARSKLVEITGAEHGFAVHNDPKYTDPQSREWQAFVIHTVVEWLTAEP